MSMLAKFIIALLMVLQLTSAVKISHLNEEKSWKACMKMKTTSCVDHGLPVCGKSSTGLIKEYASICHACTEPRVTQYFNGLC